MFDLFATCLLVSLKRGITAVQCTFVLTGFIICLDLMGLVSSMIMVSLIMGPEGSLNCLSVKMI